jgi:hypothetical protein
MIVRCNLSASDYRAFQRHVLFRYRKIHWVFGALLTFLMLVTWFGGESTSDKINGLVGVIVVFGAISALLFLVLRFVGSRFRGTVGEHVFDISEAGITESNASGKVETHLSGIRNVDETKTHFFVITGAGLGHVLPKRDLEQTEPLRLLQAAVRGRAT